MSDEKDLEDQKAETNPLKYAKKYMNPNGEMEPLGFDPLTEEFQRRLEDRVNRFGVQTEAMILNKENLQALFESLGVDPPNEFFKTNAFESTDISDENDKNEENILANDATDQKNGVDKGSIRYEAIHLHGVDEMSTKDIFIYLDEFPPKFVEWVNDSSCNVVYSDFANACKVLLAKSKPYDEEEGVKTKERKERHGKEERDENDDDDTDMEVDEPNNNKDEKAIKERWRLGDSYTKASKLLMRFARPSDQKMGGRPHESNFYQKYGNPNLKIWTKNFKNKTNQKQDGDDDVPRKKNNDNDVGNPSGDDNDASTVTEDRKNGSVKDRLGNRQDIRVRVSRSRSNSRTRPRGQRTKRRSGEKYSLRTRSKVAMDDDGEMTSFDRHVMEELEERKIRRGREGRRELWIRRKRHIEHDEDRAGSGDNDGLDNDSYRHGGSDYKLRRYGGYDDDNDRHDNDGGRKVDRGSVKSRLGEVKRSRVDDGERRFDEKFGNSDVERSRLDDDDDEGGGGGSYRRGRGNYDGYDDDVPINKVKSSVFKRLGSRN